MNHQGAAVAVVTSVHSDRASFQAKAILGSLAWSLAGALFLAGAWLMARRLTGALASPLHGGAIVVVGVCAVLCAAMSRLLGRSAVDGAMGAIEAVRDWLPTIALALVATSAVIPGSSVVAIVFLWTLVAAEETAAALFIRLTTDTRHPVKIRIRQRLAGGVFNRRLASGNGSHGPGAFADDLRQRHTRQHATDGGEIVYGTLRAGFAAGQRTAIEHLVFCPLLAAVPRLLVAAVNEPDCAVRATHSFRYGARLEIRLREPCDEPTEVLVRYEARVSSG
jgi:hypothetical protein